MFVNRSWSRFAVVLMTAMLAVTAAAVPAQAKAPACWNASCNWLDPQATGCSAGAYTMEEVTVVDIRRLELRYSPSCNAVWARATQGISGAIGKDLVSVDIFFRRTDTEPMQFVEISGVNEMGAGQTVWSPMFQFSPWWVAACVGNYNAPTLPDLYCTPKR